MWLWMACAPEPEQQLEPELVLEPGFENQIVQGWVCGDQEYFGLDADERFRVQVSLPGGEAELLSPSPAYFRVYVGENLVVDEGEDPCDELVVKMGDEERLDHAYSAVQGRAWLVPDGRQMGLQVEEVLLRPDPELLDPQDTELPEVALESARLPSFRVW